MVQFIDDIHLIVFGAFESGRYAVFNTETSEVYYISDYPKNDSEAHKDESNITKYSAYQGYMCSNPENSKFIAISSMSYNFEILEFKNGLLTKVGEKALNHPEYRKAADGSAVFKRENKLSFAYSDVTNDFIYLLYIGRSLVDHSENYTYGNEIHVFDWDGNEKIKYLLNRDVKAISVDARNNKIYGLSINPESLTPELGYFEY